jgi:hypothetical protein
MDNVITNAAPESRQRGEDGGKTIRKSRLGQIKVAEIVTAQSSSASRFTAGAAGFLILGQYGERPERYRDSNRFDTMPSQPSNCPRRFPRCRAMP